MLIVGNFNCYQIIIEACRAHSSSPTTSVAVYSNRISITTHNISEDTTIKAISIFYPSSIILEMALKQELKQSVNYYQDYSINIKFANVALSAFPLVVSMLDLHSDILILQNMSKLSQLSPLPILAADWLGCHKDKF